VVDGVVIGAGQNGERGGTFGADVGAVVVLAVVVVIAIVLQNAVHSIDLLEYDIVHCAVIVELAHE